MNKLNKFRFFMNIAIAALVASSCSEDQTSLSVDNIKGKANIKGVITFNEGQAYQNGKFTEIIKPYAKDTVFVKIANSSLDPQGQAMGYTTYIALTDENGQYEVEVPAVDTQNGTQVTVQTKPYTGKRNMLVSWENEKPVFEAQEVIFKGEFTETVHPYDIALKDVLCGFTPRNSETGYPKTVELQVKVGENGYDLNDFGTKPTPIFKLTSGIDVVIKVVYDNDEDGDGYEDVRLYGATTNSNGYAIFSIPAKEETWSNALITTKVAPYIANNFNYYNENTGLIIGKGTYNQVDYSFENTLEGITSQYNFTPISAPVVSVKMVFNPFESAENKDVYNKYKWSNVNTFK